MHSSDKPWLTSQVKAFIAQGQKALTDFGKDSRSLHKWRNKVQKQSRTGNVFYEGKVKSLKSANVSRWWSKVKNVSGVFTNDGQ